MSANAMVATDLPLKLIAKGKVRDVYDAGLANGHHAGAILFVATDRISAFDIVLENVSSSSLIAGQMHGTRADPLDLSGNLGLRTTGHPKQGQASACTLHFLVRPLDTIPH